MACHAQEPIPFYRNKSYITLLTLILFVVGGFYVVKGALALAVNKITSLSSLFIILIKCMQALTR